MRIGLLALLLSLLVAGCGGGSGARGDDVAAAGFTNPVIAGQYPDPSAIRAADGSFWLTTTSRAWAPVFPLFRSRDLVNWTRVGGIFERAPDWMAGPFWAPELTRWGADGGVRVYYTARPRGVRDPLPCIGVASAPGPGGPYRDRGRPLFCPPSGAIDAFVLRDEHGRPQLLFRRYRNGGGIWAVPLRSDGLALAGRARLLLAPGPDDGGVVEGPAVVRHDGAFTLLFATGSCCRPPCDYREATARSRSLLGPYVRDPQPLLRDGERLRCDGHGTVVGDGRGRQWLLHHGVLDDDPLNVRRSVVLDPLRWGGDGWPLAGDDGKPIDSGAAPLGVRQRPAPSPTPSLAGTRLDPGWEWPSDAPARARQRDGRIVLRGAPRGAVLARQVP
ncbi:glycoside hydrolase family 43 protein, partial [Conexibacter sp. JD483]|uniref:glycoside hydrolase family 43 protein n=3 Tax=Conexibacter TaxID=191494 RepID=UPI0028704C48